MRSTNDMTDEVSDAADGETADESEPEPATAVMATSDAGGSDAVTQAFSTETPEEPERRFTAPSAFDAGSTHEDRHAVRAGHRGHGRHVRTWPAKPVAPQVIPPRGDAPKPPRSKPPQLGLGDGARSW